MHVEVALDCDDPYGSRHGFQCTRPGKLGPVIEVIGAPFDAGGKRQGSRMGPAAARLGGILEALAHSERTAHDIGDLPQANHAEDKKGIKSFQAVRHACVECRAAVLASLGRGATPLVVGGDHSIAMGTLGAALEHAKDELAVLWVDAHADLNTAATTPSGNVHGMPLGLMMGFPSGCEGLKDKQWGELQSAMTGGGKLGANQVAWLGLRDVDDPEAEHFHSLSGQFASTMYDIDRRGLVHELERFDRWMREGGRKRLWISFDVDSLDPFLAPGTGTAVRGGLTYREMHLMGEFLHEVMASPGCPYELLGLDVVEINPIFDANNETARTAVEWIASLFGKTILGKK